MPKRVIQHVVALLTTAFLLHPPHCAGAGQFVEITTEVKMHDWDYWFLSDNERLLSSNRPPENSEDKTYTRRCIVGAKTWLLESDFADDPAMLWFNGTDIIRYSTNTGGSSGFTRISIAPSADGNPDTDSAISPYDGPARACWLAFCSGPALRSDKHKIYPLGPFWVESGIYYYGWKDQEKVFPDALALPQRLTLVSTNNQIIFEYQVHQVTNIFGWRLPTEFYGVQYIGSVSNGWRVDLTFQGKVAKIREVPDLQVPPAVIRKTLPPAAKP